MKEVKKIIYYGLVGITGTFIDLLVLFLLVEIGHFPIIGATIISFILAATNNFIWNKVWTFKNKNKAYHHQYLKFLIVSIIGLSFTVLLMYYLNGILHFWYITAKIITSVIVLCWNYLGNRNWTFKVTNAKIFPDQKYRFDYSIIIPAYNEETRIDKTLSSIKKFLLTFPYRCEVLVINDGSTDYTSRKIEVFESREIILKKIDLIKNYGKGYAVRTGVENSQGQYILFMDADGSTPIEELLRLQKYLLEYDVIIGSRKLNESLIETIQPLSRRIISNAGSILSRLLIRDIKDTQCGFKLMKHQVAKELFGKQQIKRFGFDLELLALSQFYGFKIIEIPIKWKNDPSSSFRPVRDTFLTLRDFLIIQYNFLRKRY